LNISLKKKNKRTEKIFKVREGRKKKEKKRKGTLSKRLVGEGRSKKEEGGGPKTPRAIGSGVGVTANRRSAADEILRKKRKKG